MSDSLRPPQPSREDQDSSPFDEPKTPIKMSFSLKGLVVGLRDWPDLLMLVTFLALDMLLVVGSVWCGRIEPSHLLPGVSWLRCRPFTSALQSIDAIFFALASWQVALLSFGAVFSCRSFVLKVGASRIVHHDLVLWMKLVVNAEMASLLGSLLCISLGVMFVSTWLWSRGWGWTGRDGKPLPTVRFGVKEMMFATSLLDQRGHT